MSISVKSLLVVLLICCAFSCSKNEDDQPAPIAIEEPQPEPEPLPDARPIIDVYAMGMKSDGIKDIAKIWKNGIAASLNNGANNATATSVYVAEEDVYIGGYENNGTTNRATIWKNGVKTPTKRWIKGSVSFICFRFRSYSLCGWHGGFSNY